MREAGRTSETACRSIVAGAAAVAAIGAERRQAPPAARAAAGPPTRSRSACSAARTSPEPSMASCSRERGARRANSWWRWATPAPSGPSQSLLEGLPPKGGPRRALRHESRDWWLNLPLTSLWCCSIASSRAHTCTDRRERKRESGAATPSWGQERRRGNGSGPTSFHTHGLESGNQQCHRAL